MKPATAMRAAACLGLMLAGAARAWAQAAPGDDLDDPKLARRLKSRVSFPVAGTPPVPGAAPSPPSDGLAATPSPSIAPALLPPPPVTSAPLPAAPAGPAGSPTATIESTSTAKDRERKTSEEVKGPLLELSYRRFSFVRLGAVDPSSTSGKSAGEPFDSVSMDFYPISSLIRFGISTQYGWQSGTFDSGSGDYFIAQSFSLGVQRRGEMLTPFAQALGGAGYMRRFQFARTVPTAYWQLGVDAGVDVFLARHAYLSAAIGYLHPVNGFAKEQSFATMYVDTWSFKLGFGI